MAETNKQTNEGFSYLMKLFYISLMIFRFQAEQRKVSMEHKKNIQGMHKEVGIKDSVYVS